MPFPANGTCCGAYDGHTKSLGPLRSSALQSGFDGAD